MEPNRTKNYTQMIAPWRNANQKGKLLIVGCVINIIVAVILARSGSYMAIFSIVMAAYCGMLTYHPHYQYQDAKDINERGKE